jgi:hypothetical protein
MDVRSAKILENAIIERLIKRAYARGLLELPIAKAGPGVGASLAEAARIPHVVDTLIKYDVISFAIFKLTFTDTSRCA